jgi:fructose-1,6-bisphosphatase I
MVADIHRNMIKGGVFLYPTTASAPNGKLRLVYECNPMAFIIEQAGGRATDGFDRILEKEVVSLHQRSCIFIGSKNMVLKVESLMEAYSPKTVEISVDATLEKLGVIGGID